MISSNLVCEQYWNQDALLRRVALARLPLVTILLLKLVSNAIHQSLPTSLDQVLGNAHGSPGVMTIAGFDEHSNHGVGGAFGVQHANFIIGQADVLNAGEESGQ